MNQSKSFRKYFELEIRPGLSGLNNKRTLLNLNRYLSKLLGVLAIILFTSMFMGILNTIMSEAGSSVIFMLFKGFFYLVLFIILVTMVSNLIKKNKSGFMFMSDDKVVIYFVSAAVAVFIMVIAYFIGLYFFNIPFGFPFIIRVAMAMGAFVILGLLSAASRQYVHVVNKKYARIIMPKILKFIDPKIVWDEKSAFPEADFKSNLMHSSKNITRYRGYNRVVGLRDTIPFVFSELSVTHKIVKKSSGKMEIKYESLFKGLFYEMKIPATLNGFVMISPDNMSEFLGSKLAEFVSKYAYDNIEKVMIDDPDFEENFSVYANKDANTEEIVSPGLRKKLLELSEKWEPDFTVYIFDSKFQLGIKSDEDIFRPDSADIANDFETINGHYEFLESLVKFPSIIADAHNSEPIL
jgi:Protein of unknown function (DUF3137)